MQQAKEINIPIEKIWIDGGNAKILAKEITQSNLPAKDVLETTEGLVLRGIWAWLLQNL
jgi:type III pantothenate kinase